MILESLHHHPELGKPLKKPYSIGSTMKHMTDEKMIGFIVKKVRDGWMSDYLVKEIKVWDLITMTWPLGHMTLKEKPEAVLLISTGSGLSPIYSHYLHLLNDPDIPIAQLYGERFAEYLLPSTLEAMSIQSDRVLNIITLSKEPSNSTHRHKGYVQDYISEALAFLKGKKIQAILCGKPEMVDEVRTILWEHGITKEQIQFEKY